MDAGPQGPAPIQINPTNEVEEGEFVNSAQKEAKQEVLSHDSPNSSEIKSNNDENESSCSINSRNNGTNTPNRKKRMKKNKDQGKYSPSTLINSYIHI